MILNILIDFVNLIISAVGKFLNVLVNILPTSPFSAFHDLDIPYLAELNWIIPISLFISILQVWLVTIGVYLVISVALRWVKVIE